MQKDHADLNTLRASRTHQENTLSYSRRQELGLAVVEQYSIKQMSVSFQSRARLGLENRDCNSPPPLASPRQPRFPRVIGGEGNFSLILILPLSSFLLRIS